MLSYLTLKNFKCFEEQSFALGNLTIVAGANGAGKSTLIQALMLLRQSDMDKRTLLSEKVQLRGSLVNLKSADSIRYFESEDTDVIISIEDDTIDDALDVTIVNAVKDEDTCTTNVSGNLSEFESNCALFSKDLVYLAANRVGPGEVHFSNLLLDSTEGRIGDKLGLSAASYPSIASTDVSKRSAILTSISTSGIERSASHLYTAPTVTPKTSAKASWVRDLSFLIFLMFSPNLNFITNRSFSFFMITKI